MPIRIHLDRLLAARGLTQKELSERIGITPANLNIFTTGKAKAVRFTTLEAICRELDCQPGDLLHWEE
ncbi:helix-turn-helix domain-containing protein [Actomonas aquatica]|uniref:Helix-turn-helix transcriptional regulator n=1 Tax=Actomonas aquatica TaxID=2866162 RepID=A0ABZ1CEV7_9BACT|nr:helix-turn-helix transcriptional regulator [Opitutus sp. WL0086]WRQ89900.1 helix-turn-helix transcriptional regulator [Opitutus sp. WL0086]